MGKDYHSMTKAELETELKRLKDNLEDLEEMMSFSYSKSSAHISGGQVKQDEESLCELQEEVALVERLLAGK